jgi:hypothetical protein
MRTFRIADASELIAALPEPIEHPAASVTLPEPMLGYACNQRGCCCSGWSITWKPSDLVRLGKRIAPEDRPKLLAQIDVRENLDASGNLEIDAVYVTNESGACRFLGSSGGCGVHATIGVDALPDICADFPVAAYNGSSGAEFFYDPVCPSVLDALAAPTPARPVRLNAPYADGGLARRAAHAREAPEIRFGVAKLSAAEFESIRDRVVASFADSHRSVLEHLQAVDAAYAEVGRGERAPGDFTIAFDRNPAEYSAFFRDRLAAHHSRTLAGVFRNYRRFVFEIQTDERSAPWHELEKHLRSWERAEDCLTPELSMIQLRYLAHRNFSPFFVIQGRLHFAAGGIVHIFGTALRFAAAFAAVLRRPVDVPIMKTALGTSEYVYRSLEIDPRSLPWFGLST